jgi:class 3 adenylate cyclase
MSQSQQHDQFYASLLQYSQEFDTEKRAAIEKQLWQIFGDERAVFVMDMSGFSRLVQRHGIIHYLSMIHRMQLTARPVIESYGGTVIKFVADNCFATFPEPLAAVRSSIALNLAFDAANIVTPDELDIWIACGIDYGPILVLDESDLFGNAVNCASKLGEDIARSREILVTQAAKDKIPEPNDIQFEAVNFSISGINIDAYHVHYSKQP